MNRKTRLTFWMNDEDQSFILFSLFLSWALSLSLSHYPRNALAPCNNLSGIINVFTFSLYIFSSSTISIILFLPCRSSRLLFCCIFFFFCSCLLLLAFSMAMLPFRACCFPWCYSTETSLFIVMIKWIPF